MIPIYLAVYCKERKANFASFPSDSPGKARAVFKLYLRVRSKLIEEKKTEYMMVRGNLRDSGKLSSPKTVALTILY